MNDEKMKVIRRDDLEVPENGESRGELKRVNNEPIYRNTDVCRKCGLCEVTKEIDYSARTQYEIFKCKKERSRQYAMSKARYESTTAPVGDCIHLKKLKANPPWKGKITMRLDYCRKCNKLRKREEAGSDSLYGCLIADESHTAVPYTKKDNLERQPIPEDCIFLTEYLVTQWNNKGGKKDGKKQ